MLILSGNTMLILNGTQHLAADEADGTLPDIQPGVTYEGDDLGRWTQRQRRDWKQLSAEQQKRLSALGMKPAERPPAAAARKGAGGPGKLSASFQQGVAALVQYIAREGTHRVPRGHTEEITVDGKAEPVTVRLGIWISNTKTRRDKLTQAQRATLAELGVEWA
jgi:hypothetical protein